MNRLHVGEGGCDLVLGGGLHDVADASDLFLVGYGVTAAGGGAEMSLASPASSHIELKLSSPALVPSFGAMAVGEEVSGKGSTEEEGLASRMGSGEEDRKRERRRGGGPRVRVQAGCGGGCGGGYREWRSGGGGGEHELANATSSPSSSAAAEAARCFSGCVCVDEQRPWRED
jgi:hypothetical protein